MIFIYTSVNIAMTMGLAPVVGVPLPMFNELKLRFTQGTAGSRPRFTARFETWNVSGGVVSKGNLGNKELIPEFQTETEMGFDATLMDRFSISATYVNATTECLGLEC